MFAERPFRFTFALCVAFAALGASRASAIPIFAQRYHLECGACHTALPELNAFGNEFRDRGYRLPDGVPRHGTTLAAVRYNLEYEKAPAPGSERFAPAASIVSDAELGHINAYLHYGLGAGGAPAAVYLGFLSTYDAHVRQLYRLGLYETPLPQSPGQRLDSISTYGYFGTSVGQNDLDLNAPRLGIETERRVGASLVIASLAFGEFKGAAYGGKPVFTGATTVAARPELSLFGRFPLGRSIDFNVMLQDGERKIALPGRAPFDDPYDRIGYGADVYFFKRRLDLSGEQFFGRDDDADGADGAINSSGGFVRLRYNLTPHVYVATRYDTAANPFAKRSLIEYAGALVGKRARIIVERRNNLLGGLPTLGGYLTIAAPWPLH